MLLCVVMQPCEAKAARNGKPAKEAAVDSEDLDRQLEEMKARIESQLPPKESDDDSISNAELGLMELARSAKNPKLMAQALEDLKDPEIAAQVRLAPCNHLLQLINNSLLLYYFYNDHTILCTIIGAIIDERSRISTRNESHDGQSEVQSCHG